MIPLSALTRVRPASPSVPVPEIVPARVAAPLVSTAPETPLPTTDDPPAARVILPVLAKAALTARREPAARVIDPLLELGPVPTRVRAWPAAMASVAPVSVTVSSPAVLSWPTVTL